MTIMITLPVVKKNEKTGTAGDWLDPSQNNILFQPVQNMIIHCCVALIK